MSKTNLKQNIRLKFWGVRGSIPSPGPHTHIFGGNTSCVEMRCGNELLIFDAGSGIRELGLALMKNLPVKARLFFSHYHWDHILGFPFFTPLYVPGNQIDIYGESKQRRSPRRILAGQMTYPYFPVALNQLGANLSFHTIKPQQTLKFEEITIKTHNLNHPFGSLGYRVEYQESTVAYITDYEHGAGIDEELIEFVQGVDALIYDSSFNQHEYVSRQGWGHSTWEQGIKIAHAANAKLLFIFHHEPIHNDDFMHQVEKEARSLRENVIVAREQHEFWF